MQQSIFLAASRLCVEIFRYLMLAGFVLIVPAAGAAEDVTTNKSGSPCTGFDWQMAPELKWIKAGPRLIESGTEVKDNGEGAYLVRLERHDDVKFALPPERERFPDGPYAGVLIFKTLPGPGLYQVTLTNKGWIDAISDGNLLKSVKGSNSKTCAPLRKSVRFNVPTGSLTIQISSVNDTQITIAIRKIGTTE